MWCSWLFFSDNCLDICLLTVWMYPVWVLRSANLMISMSLFYLANMMWYAYINSRTWVSERQNMNFLFPQGPLEKIRVCCICLLFFLSSSFFSIPLVFEQSASKWGKKAETTTRISLCWFSPLLFVMTLIGKVSSMSHTFHFSSSFGTATRPFNPNLLSVSSVDLFLLSLNLFCSL